MEPWNRALTNESKYSFKNLELWKMAQDFAVEIARVVDGLPARRSADVVGRQILRSATSIAANIAEGHGRFSLPAYRNHLSIAKGSAAETQSWLDMLTRQGFINEEEGAALEKACEVLIAALTRRILALERQEQDQRGPNRIREDAPVYFTDPPEVQRFPGSKVRELSSQEDEL